MAKILLETIRKISFDTKPGNEGISFRRIKGRKAQFLDFSMKRRMEMKVWNRQNWPNIGPFFPYCRIEFPNQLRCSKIRKKPLEKNHYMFLYYVFIFLPIPRLCVIINEVLISPEFGMVRPLVRCLENLAEVRTL